MKRRDFLKAAALIGGSTLLPGDTRIRTLRERLLDPNDTTKKIVGIAYGSWTYDTINMDVMHETLERISRPTCDDGRPGFANFMQLHFSYQTPSISDPRIEPRSNWTRLRLTNEFARNTPDIMDGRLIELINHAHDLGLGVMLKMHVNPCIVENGRNGYTDRARINFGNDEHKWRSFFDRYEDLSRRYARLAVDNDVEMMAFATELQGTIHRTANWYRIVESIRDEGFRGSLLYAGLKTRRTFGVPHIKGDSDATHMIELSDFIAPHYYGPLGSRSAWSTEDLTQDYMEVLDLYKRLAQQHSKPILMTETGMLPIRAQSADPWDYGHLRPWHPEWRRFEDERMQTRWIQSVVHQTLRAEEVKGVFWWGYASDYTLANREAEQYLQLEYRPHACGE